VAQGRSHDELTCTRSTTAPSELPSQLLAAYLELPATLEVAPDTVGAPLVAANPGGMRTEAVGPDRELVVCFGKWADPQRRVVVYAVVF
jgi:hypothetical protein